MMTHAIRLHQAGTPELMQWESIALPPPAAGEVRLRHHAIGLNYIDTYHRSGLYPLPLPSGLGQEGAGVVEAVGEGVSEVAVGDRVAYATAPLGAYAEARNVPADVLVPLPDALSFEQGAAMLMQGLTAQYLLRRTYRVQAGDTILVHAAAGGVGTIMCQWAKALGATVIGTVGSEHKAELARANGCDHPIVYTRENFARRVRELTDGEGVPVVFDSIGKDTFMDSLACLRPLGLMVSFGNASGAVPLVDIGVLARMGSLFLTRPTLFTYAARRSELLAMASELFDLVVAGTLRVEINQRYALKDVAQAHRDLEGRRTSASSILLP